MDLLEYSDQCEQAYLPMTSTTGKPGESSSVPFSQKEVESAPVASRAGGLLFSQGPNQNVVSVIAASSPTLVAIFRKPTSLRCQPS